jgi:esterase/lipase superfamily enzyme
MISAQNAFQRCLNWRGSISLFMLSLSFVVLMAGCTAKQEFIMMETPAIYHEAAIDPFAHLDDTHLDTVMSVFYATNRQPQDPGDHSLPYGNRKDSVLHLGSATLRFGNDDFSWEELYAASIATNRDYQVMISLADFIEMASLPEGYQADSEQSLTPAQQAFAAAINAQLAKAQDKEIMVYVNGTKVDFLNAVAMTAEIDHFAGRDFVGLAFSWPSHQNILYYLLRVDVTRAKDSSGALRALLEFLAAHTTAERINILSYSAGGRVASKALYELRSAYPDLDRENLRKTFRLGSVILAAADIPLETFHKRLPAISDLSEQVVVTVSDHDPALHAAEKYMGGGMRIGEEIAEEEEVALARSLGIANFEVIDLSLGQEGRGFDIIGHHYWYRHPWASSDIVVLLRTDLPPHRRGLSPSELEGVYYMSPEYPEDVRESLRRELQGSWFKEKEIND